MILFTLQHILTAITIAIKYIYLLYIQYVACNEGCMLAIYGVTAFWYIVLNFISVFGGIGISQSDAYMLQLCLF